MARKLLGLDPTDDDDAVSKRYLDQAVEAVRPVTLIESPLGSGMFRFSGLTEDPDHPGLYLPTGLDEDDDHSGQYIPTPYLQETDVSEALAATPPGPLRTALDDLYVHIGAKTAVHNWASSSGYQVDDVVVSDGNLWRRTDNDGGDVAPGLDQLPIWSLVSTGLVEPVIEDGELLGAQLPVSLTLNDWALYLRNYGDLNHSIRWGWGDYSIDGPVITGAGGVGVVVGDSNAHTEQVVAEFRPDGIWAPGDLVIGSDDGAVTVWGNAATASKLAAAVTINGVSFDGSDNITVTDESKVPATRTINGHTLSEDVTVTKADIGLGSVDNTADTDKPISTATQTALTARALTTRTLTAGTGLVGGGDLTADRTFTVDFGTGAGKVTQGNDPRLSDTRTPSSLSVATGTIIDAAVTLAKLSAGVQTSLGKADTALQLNSALGTPSSGDLTNCTFPILNQNTTGSAATLTTARTFRTNLASTSTASFNGSADVTPGVTGTLPVGNGGSGATSLTGLLVGNGTSAFTTVTAPSGAVVGTTDTQSLTNKTIDAPALTGTTKIAQSGALEAYNTSDQTTNYERLSLRFNSNVGEIIATYGGTGTARALRIGAAGSAGSNTSKAFTMYGAYGPWIQQEWGTTSGSDGVAIGANSSFTNTSGTRTALSITPTINNSSTGGYTALLINPTETATGSGTKRLISAQVGGADKFVVDNTGAITATAATLGGATALTTTGAQAVSNKTITSSTISTTRITPRATTTTSSATPTINTDNYDIYGLTAQAVDITSFTTNLSGTPTDGQKLWIYIKGTGSRAISWGASFESGPVALPTTTTGTQRLDVGFIYNSATSCWRCVASGSA